MKGAAEIITDTLFIVGTIVIMLALLLEILPNFLNFLQSAALDSSDFVAKETAELITVSAAAPNSIQISYNPSKNLFDFDVNNRIVKISSLINKNNNGRSETMSIKQTSLAKIAVDVSASFQNINIFDIEKSLQGILVQAR